MKRSSCWKSLLGAVALMCAPSLFAEDLIQVYKDALQNDPAFQQALANRDIVQTQIPINFANLLPTISATELAGYQRVTDSGAAIPVIDPNTGLTTESENISFLTTSARTLQFSLNLQQNIFNWTNWLNLVAARDSVKGAYATYSAAVQDLIQRTAQAYFNVLDAEDTLTYTDSEKRAFYKQFVQAKESYEVGVKTITDVYNAKASYDSSVASYVTAVNGLADAKESLAAITGKYYKSLKPLVHLPLVTPKPNSIDDWTQMSITHNWQLTAAHYNMLSAHAQISAAEGGHMPTLTFQGNFTNAYTHNISQSNPANSREKDLNGTLNLTLPIYTGGLVSANVDKAIATYNLTSGQFQSTYRDVVKNTRQSFLGVISGISKVQADEQAVISQQSSLDGTEEGYRVGTRTIIDVLNVETNLYNALKQNATDRYAYVMSLIDLKESAGTLDANDLAIINSWLGTISSSNLKALQKNARHPISTSPAVPSTTSQSVVTSSEVQTMINAAQRQPVNLGTNAPHPPVPSTSPMPPVGEFPPTSPQEEAAITQPAAPTAQPPGSPRSMSTSN